MSGNPRDHMTSGENRKQIVDRPDEEGIRVEQEGIWRFDLVAEPLQHNCVDAVTAPESIVEPAPLDTQTTRPRMHAIKIAGFVGADRNHNRAIGKGASEASQRCGEIIHSCEKLWGSD
ncbi:MAG TPA: hypothetical protein VK756_08680 [Solirubrobacteraceae bacterium]|nr:hypothetical protein [Solirubrobacteraceae bacterium]